MSRYKHKRLNTQRLSTFHKAMHNLKQLRLIHSLAIAWGLPSNVAKIKTIRRLSL